MDVLINAPRPSYDFSLLDEEILADHLLNLSSDEDTWLYKIEGARGDSYGLYDQCRMATSSPNHQAASGGAVDSRTFTRRKRCSLRPSLESVVESPLANNRSSLGLLTHSTLLNGTLQTPCTTPHTITDRTSLDSTGSDPILPRRVFKLHSPFTNPSNVDIEMTQLDTKSSNIYVPQASDSPSGFDSGEEVSFRPPTAFQDENMTASLLSIPEHQGQEGEQMTDSMVHYLEPVNCRPPSGFEDGDMHTSVLDVNTADQWNNCNSNSVIDYLESEKQSPTVPLTERTASSETENIPPKYCNNIQQFNNYSNCTRKKEDCIDSIEEMSILNSTYELVQVGDRTFTISNEEDEMANISFTNVVNTKRKNKDRGEAKDLNKTITINTDLNKELTKDGVNQHKTKALNNRDLNMQELPSDDVVDVNLSKHLTRDPNKMNSSYTLSSNNRNRTFTKSELEEALSSSNNFSSRQIPSRNSSFNSTFAQLAPQVLSNTPVETKLYSQLPSPANRTRLQSRLNNTYNKSMDGLNGGLDEPDDQSSSASDSSFSSSSTKPRSVDELRSIAQQQESSLAQHTSTPTDFVRKPTDYTKLDLDLSPIRRLPLCRGRVSETRSANSSPVRSQQLPDAHQSPLAMERLQQPSVEERRQTLQASSMSNIARPMSNIARPRVSGLRMPQPVGQLRAPQRSDTRPGTAPAPSAAPTPVPRAIPRPQLTRLPMPRFRGTGIPGLKRGGRH